MQEGAKLENNQQGVMTIPFDPLQKAFVVLQRAGDALGSSFFHCPELAQYVRNDCGKATWLYT